MSAKKRIVLNTFGSYGDIHPFMAMALELQRRGHDSVVATMPLYREKIEAAGLRFFPIRPDLPPPQEQEQQLIEKIMDPRRGPKFLMEEIIFAGVRDSYEDLTQAVAGADLLVTHPAAPAGPLVGRKTNTPWVSTVLAPMSFLSAYNPPVPPYWAWINYLRLLGPGVMKVFLDLVKKSFDTGPFDKLRQELGLTDAGNPVAEGQHSPDLVLALFSQIFAAPQPDWPRQAKVTGFAFYDGHREMEMPSELTDFLAAGPPPLVFTLGSSAVWVAQDFFHESIAAAKALSRRAVLLIGDERNLPAEPLPAQIIPVSYAPFESLLPRACALVHHGGIGTTSQGLRAGVPTLIVPFAFDQPDNAAHAERLGTSRTLSRKDYKSGRVAKELQLLLSTPDYAVKASDVGERIRAESGTANACDLIEEFLLEVDVKKRDNREPSYAVSN